MTNCTKKNCQGLDESEEEINQQRVGILKSHELWKIMS